MAFGTILQSLSLINLFVLIGLILYLSTKASEHATLRPLLLAFLPLTVFQLGSYFFVHAPTAFHSSTLIILGAGLIPLGVTPFSQALARNQTTKRISRIWIAYYGVQLLLFVILAKELFTGQLIECSASG